MARKALLIGSQTGELSGVHNDIESMAAALDRWGFISTRCEAADASRGGILDAYERLITDADDDDAIVIYYSGHGGYCKQRETPTAAQPRMAMQFIVPTDFDQSTDGDFRGIMSVELSMLLARLTGKTKNVTVALDCCHAAHMCRNPGLKPKALPRPVHYDVVVSHFESLQQRVPLDVRLPRSNPWAVRVVACAPEQSAYEHHNSDGVPTGMLTDALTRALTQVHGDGLRVSWATVLDRVRQEVLNLMPAQRPDAEGPAQRLLFETEQADPTASLPVVVNGERILLGGATLLGVRVGDQFTVMPVDSAGPHDDTKVGDVVIDRVETTSAGGVLRLRSPELSVPLGARAFQTTASAPPMPVRLPQDGQRFPMLAQEVMLSPILRAGELDEPCPAEVCVDEAGSLTVWDNNGPLHAPHLASVAGIAEIMRNLKRVAWANRLRCLDADPAHELDTDIEVDFGVVSEGEAEPLSTSGAILYIGQKIYLTVRNKGSQRVYVSLLDIGVSAKVSVLNPASPGGEAVDPGTEYTLGWNDFKHTLQGLPLSWPMWLPRTQPRPETIIVLVTSEPQIIHGLEQPAARDGDGAEAGAEAGPRSSLQGLIDQIDHGGARQIARHVARDGARGGARDGGTAMRYTVRTVDFELVPVSPPVSEDPEFQVDERPPSSMRLWSPKGAAPQTIAVRLTDLVVHHNRAFRSADVRLDAMVLTRGPGKQPVYGAWTERFSNIHDGQTLPLDKILVYHGAAVDYLDLAVWVSRDVSGSLALSDLLQEKLTDSDVQLAMGQLGGLLASAPQAAAAVAAIGAGAVVINAAYHLLTGIVGNSIGLYRTTLLAGERFGVGRPADQCTIRAQDFSFTYLIEDVG